MSKPSVSRADLHLPSYLLSHVDASPYADVTLEISFSVSLEAPPKTISRKLHALILSQSPTLRRLLRSVLRSSTSSSLHEAQVTIPGDYLSEEVIDATMTFLYSGKFTPPTNPKPSLRPFTSPGDPSLLVESLFGVIEASSFLLLPNLSRAAQDHLLRLLSPVSAVALHEFCASQVLVTESVVKDAAWAVILQRPEAIERIHDLSIDSIIALAVSDELFVPSELHRFLLLRHWARHRLHEDEDDYQDSLLKLKKAVACLGLHTVPAEALFELEDDPVVQKWGVECSLRALRQQAQLRSAVMAAATIQAGESVGSVRGSSLDDVAHEAGIATTAHAHAALRVAERKRACAERAMRDLVPLLEHFRRSNGEDCVGKVQGAGDGDGVKDGTLEALRGAGDEAPLRVTTSWMLDSPPLSHEMKRGAHKTHLSGDDDDVVPAPSASGSFSTTTHTATLSVDDVEPSTPPPPPPPPPPSPASTAPPPPGVVDEAGSSDLAFVSDLEHLLRRLARVSEGTTKVDSHVARYTTGGAIPDPFTRVQELCEEVDHLPFGVADNGAVLAIVSGFLSTSLNSLHGSLRKVCRSGNSGGVSVSALDAALDNAIRALLPSSPSLPDIFSGWVPTHLVDEPLPWTRTPGAMLRAPAPALGPLRGATTMIHPPRIRVVKRLPSARFGVELRGLFGGGSVPMDDFFPARSLLSSASSSASLHRPKSSTSEPFYFGGSVWVLDGKRFVDSATRRVFLSVYLRRLSPEAAAAILAAPLTRRGAGPHAAAQIARGLGTDLGSIAMFHDNHHDGRGITPVSLLERAASGTRPGLVAGGLAPSASVFIDPRTQVAVKFTIRLCGAPGSLTTQSVCGRSSSGKVFGVKAGETSWGWQNFLDTALCPSPTKGDGTLRMLVSMQLL